VGWTKAQLISEAYAELALAEYEFDITPEEQQAALRRMDAMMARWNSQGLRIGYTLSASPTGSSVDDDSGIPAECVEAVYMGLAVNLAAGKGKALAQSTKATAKTAFDALMSRVVSGQTTEQQLSSGTPRGAGGKTWRHLGSPFFSTPNTTPIQNTNDGVLNLGGSN
jgi:hypothetical protein